MPPQTSAVLKRRSLEVWSVWALIATLVASVVVVTPFLSVALSTTKTFILAAGAIITLIVYIIARLSRGNVVFPPFMLVGALWLPVVAYSLSSFFSGVPFATALWGTTMEPDTLGFMLVVACLGTLTALVLRSTEQYASFLKVSAGVFVAVAALEILIVVIGQYAPDTISPAMSLIGSYQDLAFILGLGVISTLITFRFVELAERNRRMLIAATAAALFLLAIANSTFVWILLVLVSLGLFLEAVMMRKHSANEDADLNDVALMNEASVEEDGGNRSIALPLPVLAVAVFFLVGGTLSGALANALHINVLSVSPSWQSTLSVAQQTYATAPIFGAGPGSFGAEWLKYRDASLNSTVFWNTDFTSGIGFIPTSLVSTGILGALAWLAFVLLFAVFGLRMLITRTPQDASVRFVAILSYIATVYLVLAAIFASPNAVVIALAFVFAGLFASTMRYAGMARQRGIIFSRSPRLGFVIVFSLTLVMFASVVVAYSLVGRYVAVMALTNANVAYSKGDIAAASEGVKSSLAFAPMAAAYQAQANIALTELRKVAPDKPLSKEDAQQFQTTLSAGINAGITATRLAPSDYQNWLALGNLYAQAVPFNVTGAYDSAKTAFEKAQALNPTSPGLRFVMAQVDIAHRDMTAAKEKLKAAIALKADFIDAIFLLSQLEVQSGNVNGALEAAINAAYFAPKDPNVLFQVGVLSAAVENYAQASVAFQGAVAQNPQFANARYFLAAVYAQQNNFASSTEQLQAVGDLSADNAAIVEPLLTKLKTGKNPFPRDLLSVSPPAVKP